MTVHILSSEPTGRLVEWVIGVMEAIGAPGAALAVALENLFPPIPSEVILPLAGFTASQGNMSLAAAIIWTTVGSVVGAVILYYLGALIGRQRVIAIAARLPLVKVSDIERTERWFLKHGSKTVFFGRMIPIFRSLISIPAGVERMALPRFLIFTTLGSLIWNTTLVVAGYVLGENWWIVETYVGVFQKIVIGVVAAAVVAFVVIRVRAWRKRSRSAVEEAEDGEHPPAVPRDM